MISIVKRILKKVFPKHVLYYRAYVELIKNETSYLHLTGWMRSLDENKPVDKDGNYIPWMNYPVIKFLQDRLKNDFHLFEFGSGYSTSFYAGLVQTVTSVEYDESWLAVVKKNKPENVELIYKERDIDGEYCRVIRSTGRKYDVVVVDGRDRVNCIKQSIESLTDRGVILFDDSQRKRYLEGINYAIEKGFRSIRIDGLKPTRNKIDGTTIFYRRNNCFDI